MIIHLLTLYELSLYTDKMSSIADLVREFIGLFIAAIKRG